MKKKADNTSKETTIDMPEVKDIPGQENIRPPHMREMSDVTASSPGEEGEGILDNLNKEDDDDDLLDDQSNVSQTERDLLRQSDRPVTDEDQDLENMKLDSTDDEDELNEGSNPMDMGEDLDIPGAELDDDDEDMGEEDEENNAYSGRD
ncbi:hypothetical protein LZZ85_20015 [Terrimonas sp. NA20]|uniref:Serine kinase/phosphatase n=1 Tax=Terrimonas ginsenosidimutans TaxID=2908004 RepID=A0ABS9KW77_9BACT|nr:hypothetical protein [Terrimonas ginsenosidimutans]MCG2616596.1 hypothetical protein [Terrimonas ginsenosidimutans]